MAFVFLSRSGFLLAVPGERQGRPRGSLSSFLQEKHTKPPPPLPQVRERVRGSIGSGDARSEGGPERGERTAGGARIRIASARRRLLHSSRETREEVRRSQCSLRPAFQQQCQKRKRRTAALVRHSSAALRRLVATLHLARVGWGGEYFSSYCKRCLPHFLPHPVSEPDDVMLMMSFRKAGGKRSVWGSSQRSLPGFPWCLLHCAHASWQGKDDPPNRKRTIDGLSWELHSYWAGDRHATDSRGAGPGQSIPRKAQFMSPVPPGPCIHLSGHHGPPFMSLAARAGKDGHAGRGPRAVKCKRSLSLSLSGETELQPPERLLVR
ncbi:hypothetical protein SKAU_G00004480 [Synaphobranchus kaupii]|uniref:Uncharacterized protein n=1 Tax=Synaphobranchus kaupii TaxID=118154 RepID=A0A9Q1G8V2_SYNKA|nr:hypothetical protein SKAU_G00004480 [Synaphobranchus kaupii]